MMAEAFGELNMVISGLLTEKNICVTLCYKKRGEIYDCNNDNKINTGRERIV